MLQSVQIEPSFFDQREDTLVAWLGMAGALINTRGTILLIDPLLTLLEPASAQVCESGDHLLVPLPIEARDIPRVDLVMYTHADGDHFGWLTAATLGTALHARFLAPAPIVGMLREMGIPAERTVTATDFSTHEIGAAEVSVTPALHDWQDENPWQREDCCGYLVRTPDGTIWHPGDTRLIDELLAVRDVDMLFFDVAAVDSHLVVLHDDSDRCESRQAGSPCMSRSLRRSTRPRRLGPPGGHLRCRGPGRLPLWHLRPAAWKLRGLLTGGRSPLRGRPLGQLHPAQPGRTAAGHGRIAWLFRLRQRGLIGYPARLAV